MHIFFSNTFFLLTLDAIDILCLVYLNCSANKLSKIHQSELNKKQHIRTKRGDKVSVKGEKFYKRNKNIFSMFDKNKKDTVVSFNAKKKKKYAMKLVKFQFYLMLLKKQLN